jgi:hypothetical protein
MSVAVANEVSVVISRSSPSSQRSRSGTAKPRWSGTRFEPEDVQIAGDRAVIRWRAHFNLADPHAALGDVQGDSVRGVNLMHVRDGRIVEALGYTKTP